MRRLTRFCWLGLFVLSPLPLAAQPPVPPAPEPPAIVTHGEATIRRMPDQAFINLQVESRDGRSREATRRNAEAMTKVQERLRTAGVGRDDMRTTGYDLQEEFDYAEGRRSSRGFVARNSVEIHVDKLDRVGEIVDAAVQSGATSVTGIRFDIKDRSGAEREALKQAVSDARERAEAMAAGAGKSLDRILRIQENFEGPTVPMRREVMQMAASDQMMTPVQPGVIEIHAAVTLVVAIK